MEMFTSQRLEIPGQGFHRRAAGRLEGTHSTTGLVAWLGRQAWKFSNYPWIPSAHEKCRFELLGPPRYG